MLRVLYGDGCDGALSSRHAFLTLPKLSAYVSGARTRHGTISWPTAVVPLANPVPLNMLHPSPPPSSQAAESLAEEMVKDFATRAKKEAQQREIERSPDQ